MTPLEITILVYLACAFITTYIITLLDAGDIDTNKITFTIIMSPLFIIYFILMLITFLVIEWFNWIIGWFSK